MKMIKRPTNYSYSEICTPIGTANQDTFPKECPCCGAEREEVKSGFPVKALYSCGGSYESIPQIQNHTDKFRGACGQEEKYNEQERVAMLAVIYNSFCNWTVFPKELKIEILEPTVKDHFIHKISWTGGNRLAHPKDFVDSYVNWVKVYFDKYKPVIDKCLGKDTHGRYIDPRFICGFDDEWNPIYVISHTEAMERLIEIGYNEYGNLQFYKNHFGGRSMLPTEGSIGFIGKDKVKTQAV